MTPAAPPLEARLAETREEHDAVLRDVAICPRDGVASGDEQHVRLEEEPGNIDGDRSS